MSIKLALLQNGETVISDVKELVSSDKVCGYLFNKPHTISVVKEMVLVEKSGETNVNRGEVQVSLSPWILLTDETQIPVHLDYVVTLVEPVQTVKQMYEEKVNVEDS